MPNLPLTSAALLQLKFQANALATLTNTMSTSALQSYATFTDDASGKSIVDGYTGQLLAMIASITRLNVNLTAG